MRIIYALLADYVGEMDGKHTIVGIFDCFHVAPNLPDRAPVEIQPHYLGVAIGLQEGDIGSHAIVLRMVDEDGIVVHTGPGSIELEVGPPTEVMGIEWQTKMRIFFPELIVPGKGQYNWELRIDNELVASVGLMVRPRPAKKLTA